MKPQFHQTVNILVQAYLNDDLAHGFCSACAVGNIVAYHLRTKPLKLSEGVGMFDNAKFQNGMYTHWERGIVYEGSTPNTCSDYQVRITGYTREQLTRIERAFERAPGKKAIDIFQGRNIDPEWMFNGLMAVVDVLAQIHGIDLTTREEAKLLFAKP